VFILGLTYREIMVLDCAFCLMSRGSDLEILGTLFRAFDAFWKVGSEASLGLSCFRSLLLMFLPF
jgi:hypothetical protein